FRPNFWTNTPDINPYNLQGGNQTMFLTRYFMAATLSSNYGMYGPVYEYMVHEAYPGKEEYLNSEKYEIKTWDWDQSTKLTVLIKIINGIRKENSALHFTNNIHLCEIDNDQIFAYFKMSEDETNYLLMVVNLDPHNRQSGWLQLPLNLLKVDEGHDLLMRELITQNSYVWNKEWNFVELDPFGLPFHLFKIEK
ncbi:MAG: alpha-1,4-glucan--maltose-1-phosphate maltosyltransferase, partial [Bacteroidetes bacterium]|nr:alpha-1,4-glucan--maltose-1-phosphate maltosyltransferase [Bacteroidota bacterium]